LVQAKRWSRPRAALALIAVVWLVGLLSIGSFSVWPDWRPGGKSLFAWIDWLSADVLLPVSALAMAILVGWRMRRETIRDELHTERPRLFWCWRFALRYIAPPAIMLILIAGVVRLWSATF
jgi:NSS family neurotransmitter:Na+ symporter